MAAIPAYQNQPSSPIDTRATNYSLQSPASCLGPLVQGVSCLLDKDPLHFELRLRTSSMTHTNLPRIPVKINLQPTTHNLSIFNQESRQL